VDPGGDQVRDGCDVGVAGEEKHVRLQELFPARYRRPAPTGTLPVKARMISP
jgi:hypothetical protein